MAGIEVQSARPPQSKLGNTKQSFCYISTFHIADEIRAQAQRGYLRPWLQLNFSVDSTIDILWDNKF